MPEDAFADNKLAALRTTSLRSKSAAEVGAQSKVQPGPDDYTYVRVKKIKRGATTEGDKLLDYLVRSLFAVLEPVSPAESADRASTLH